MLFLQDAGPEMKKETGPLREGPAVKRASPRGPFFLCTAVRASMTVEAAFILPLFLFFMANILNIFEAIRLESSVCAALRECGTGMAEAAFFLREGAGAAGVNGGVLPEGIESGAAGAVLSQAYVGGYCRDFLGESGPQNHCLEGGTGAISFLRSSILSENDEIEIVADYYIRPLVPVMAPPPFSLSSRFACRAWTGFDPTDSDPAEQEEAQEMVYVTETGTVYHCSRDCTYLKPRIRTIDASLLGTVRARDGSKYYPCEECHPRRAGAVIITPDGNRYHSSAHCSGLKRTVREVPKKSVEGILPPCSKCGH